MPTSISARGVRVPAMDSARRSTRGDFLEPALWFKQALVWYWPDVERWAKRTGRLP